MNRVDIIGRLTRDPEMSTVPSTLMTVAKISVAVDRGKDKDGHNVADYIPCKAFGKTAELIERYTRKGHKVGIDGRLASGMYERDGRKVYTLEVICDRVEFLESRKEQQLEIGKEPQPEPPECFSEIDDDTIPF